MSLPAVPAATIRFASDASIMVSWPGPAAIETSSWVFKLFQLLKCSAAEWGIENLHPAYCSLLIDFNIRHVKPAALLEHIRAQSQRVDYGSPAGGEVVTVPIRYNGPDLEEVARLTGISVDEVIRLHSEGEYRVGFLGFAPGFPYMLGLREKLICPRKSVPRLKVPAGSVAIAGTQIGIYPGESPGGWQIIGNTDVDLFDPHRTPPTLLHPGDRVCFKVLREPRAKTARRKSQRIWKGLPVLEILNGGFFSTVQDQGRFSCAHLGISAGGAADPLALRIGNQILGNAKQAAAIEMTGSGATVKFLKDAWVAVTGSDCSPRLDERPIEMWAAVPVAAGQVLQMGAIQKMRSYLSLRGGFDVESVLGSRSTFVSGNWGGFEGRELRAGDVLAEENHTGDSFAHRARTLVLQRMYSEDIRIVRVTRGPQWDWFSDAARRTFFEAEYEVTNEVNRLGIRLDGRPLEYAASQRDSEMISEGISNGAIQVPASGRPMILFCEQCTTGGYPKIANIILADMFRLGQLKPGDRFHFKETQREEAWLLNRELDETLQSLGFAI